MSTMLDVAHRQWASRPASARFWNLGHLADSLRNMTPATERTYPLASLSTRASQAAISLAFPTRGSGVLPLVFPSVLYLAGCPADFLTGTLAEPCRLATQCLERACK